MWQDLHDELSPLGLDVVTVALDTTGVDAIRPWIDKVRPDGPGRPGPTHPTLLDAAHVTDELFGIVNVPNAVWIDETGTIVRPAEGAGVYKNDFKARSKAEFEALPPKLQAMLKVASKIRLGDPDEYIAALRDWAARGADSPYALTADEVLARAGDRTAEHARAAACFEIGQELQRRGLGTSAVPWFQQAQTLFPENWTYKRQAWSIIDPVYQDPGDVYEGSWAADLARQGPERYYVPFSGA